MWATDVRNSGKRVGSHTHRTGLGSSAVRNNPRDIMREMSTRRARTYHMTGVLEVFVCSLSFDFSRLLPTPVERSRVCVKVCENAAWVWSGEGRGAKTAILEAVPAGFTSEISVSKLSPTARRAIFLSSFYQRFFLSLFMAKGTAPQQEQTSLVTMLTWFAF